MGAPMAAPPAPYFCDSDYYYDDTALSVRVWPTPDAYGDDFRNMRFTVDFTLEACTLKTAWILMYGGYTTGTPDMRVYLWDDDGFGFPNNKLDSFDVANADLPASFGWVGGDWNQDWVFTTGQEYHIGWTILGGLGDTLYCVSDKATGPHVGEERSSEYYGGAWETINSAWSVGDVSFEMESERCCTEILESTCKDLYYFRNPAYYLSAPQPVYGDTAYSERFSVGSSDTLIHVEVYVHDPGDGTFGNDDVYVSIYDDAGGLPGTQLISKTIPAGTYSAYPMSTIVDFSMDNLVFENANDFHVVLSTSGTVDYESFLFDDGTHGTGRASSIWPGQPWTPLLTGWGFDGNMFVKAYRCVDPYSDCSFGPDCITGITSFWRLPDAFGDDANAVFRTTSGLGCRVGEVGWVLYDNGSPNAYTYPSQIAIYSDAAGLPGTMIAAIPVDTNEYVLYPGVTTVDFTSLDIVMDGPYWIEIECFAPDSSTGIRTLSDAGGGGCDNQSTERYLGAWEPMCSGWNIPCDMAFYAYSMHCCEPFPDGECGAANDWFTAAGNYTRNNKSEVALEDAWCDLNLDWHYEHPLYGVGLYSGPTIVGDYIVCNFSAVYTKFDIATGSIIWEFDNTDYGYMGANVRCTPTVTTIDIGGTPTQVMFASGGNQQSVFCIDFNTKALIWYRDVTNYGAMGILGSTRYGTFTVLTQGADEVVYWGTESGNVVAANADDGTMWSGWTVNPVSIGGTTGKSGATDGTHLFFGTAPTVGDGDVIALDAATGAIDWQLSTAGLSAATIWPQLLGLENFQAGPSVWGDRVYANSATVISAAVNSRLTVCSTSSTLTPATARAPLPAFVTSSSRRSSKTTVPSYSVTRPGSRRRSAATLSPSRS